MQPTMKFQVFMHLGRTSGQGAVVAGPDGLVVEAPELAEEVGTGVVTAAHLVQTVDVMVLRMVEVETPVETLVTEPTTEVAVTGQIVSDEMMITVVTLPDAAGTVEITELDGADGTEVTDPEFPVLVLGAEEDGAAEDGTVVDEAAPDGTEEDGTTALEDGTTTLEEEPTTTELLDGAAGVVAAEETGQTVVLRGMVTVVKTVEPAGQLVTVGPQLVTV